MFSFSKVPQGINSVEYYTLIPELFYRKDGSRFHFREYSLYRGILIMKTRKNFSGRFIFSAHYYNWNTKKGRCIQVELNFQEIRLAIDKFFDTYEPQLIYNKECERKGLVIRTKSCENSSCKNFSTCKGMFRVRAFANNKNYYWVCRDHFVRREDGELRMLDNFSSPFNINTVKNKNSLKNATKNKHSWTAEDLQFLSAFINEPIKDVADALGRTIKSIDAKRTQLRKDELMKEKIQLAS